MPLTAQDYTNLQTNPQALLLRNYGNFEKKITVFSKTYYQFIINKSKNDNFEYVKNTPSFYP